MKKGPQRRNKQIGRRGIRKDRTDRSRVYKNGIVQQGGKSNADRSIYETIEGGEDNTQSRPAIATYSKVERRRGRKDFWGTITFLVLTSNDREREGMRKRTARVSGKTSS